MNEELRARKVCSRCGRGKDISEYYMSTRFTKDRGDYLYSNPECKQCTKKAVQNWRENNPKRVKEIGDRQNKTRRRIEYFRENSKKQRMTGYYEKWQKNNLDRIREYNEKRKIKKHDITPREWDDCRQYFNFRCAYCGKTWEQNKKETRKDLHKDHLINDGRNDLKNCIPSCMVCNSSKNESSLNNWYNPQNEIYSYERYYKIYKWIRYDCLKYVKKKK